MDNSDSLLFTLDEDPVDDGASFTATTPLFGVGQGLRPSRQPASRAKPGAGLRKLREESNKRAAASMLELDEPDDAPAKPERDIIPMLRREIELLRQKGLALALNAQQCEWLLEDRSEWGVLKSAQAMGPLVKEVADALRASLEGISYYGFASDRREIEQTLELLDGEHATWSLLHTTIQDLLVAEEQPAPESDLEKTARDKWVSDESFFRLATKYDGKLRRWLRVVLWLEALSVDAANSTETVRSEHYREHTQMALRRALIADGRQVSALDIDAPLSGEDSSLDKMLDERLLKVWQGLNCLRLLLLTASPVKAHLGSCAQVGECSLSP
jgi:hypothetical protein